MNLQYKLRELGNQFDERPALEKALVVTTLVLVLTWVFFSFVSAPVRTEAAALRSQLAQAQSQLLLLELREQTAITASATDPNEPVRERIARVIEAQNGLDGELQQLAGNLVTPQSMTRVLTSILERQTGLTLLSIDNVAPQLVQSSDATGAANQASQRIFKHSLNLQLEGDYLSLIGYLRRIEGFSERFFWDQLSFTQTVWPSARISIQLHTLSTEEGFVGV
jgi:MSHA biogenesis protein MshJ